MKNINLKYIRFEDRLWDLGFNSNHILRNYSEPHRHYHTLNHIYKMLEYTIDVDNINLFLAIVYHDVIYDPKRNDNEEKSIEFFKNAYEKSIENFKSEYKSPEEIEEQSKIDSNLICRMIMDTKNHKDTTRHSQPLIDADLEIFKGTFKDILEYENQIFKEYQFVDWIKYKEERIKILNKFNDIFKNENILNLIDYIENKKPNIGFMAGSFNPFTKGHLNILKKAEQIFDKVIVAYGSNPEKEFSQKDIPIELHYRQTMIYDGLLTDTLDKLGYDVTIIRGMRNSTDFQYELNQYRWLQELKNDVKVISIFCDKEYEHVSSSALRTLQKYGKKSNYIVK